MKVILPVAGSGKRVRPLTHTTTKSRLIVGKRRLLGNIMDGLEQIIDKINGFVFITDKNNDEQIKQYIKKYYPDYKADYVIQEEKLGPAHAVWLAKPYLEKDEEMMIIFNDTLFFADLTKIFSEYKDCDGLIYSFPTNDPSRFGIITLNEQGYIKEMVEKPQHDVGSDLAIVGLYYLKNGTNLMDKIEYTMEQRMKDGAKDDSKKEYYLTLPLKLMIGEGKRFKAPKLDDWLDCGKKETLLESSRKLLEMSDQKDYSSMYPGCVITPPVYISPNNVKITNSIIGPNVTIGGNAQIEDSVIKDCVISPGAKVEKIVLNYSLIGENAEMIGNYCSADLGDDSRFNMKH